MDLGHVEGTGGGNVPAHTRFGGKRFTLRWRSVPSELKRAYLRVDLGLVLCRDGAKEVQDGDGRFHGAWSARSGPGRTPRSCQCIWSFFIVRSQCFQDGAESVQPTRNVSRFLCVFF